MLSRLFKIKIMVSDINQDIRRNLLINANLDNVSSTKILIVNQCVSNSPSKIRRGWGALITQEKAL